MTETDPRDDFLKTYLSDRSEGKMQPMESYLEQFPQETVQVIRALFSGTGDEAVSDDGIRLDAGNLEEVGPYRIIRELGRGGQGIVFLAEDSKLGRKVALKVLTSWSQASPQVLVRFQREAAIASKLDHPGICTVYGTGEAHGAPYLAMRYVEGESLSASIATAATEGHSNVTSFVDLATIDGESGEEAHEAHEAAESRSASSLSYHDSVRDIVVVVEKAARALHAAHEAGVIHRDIKPGNIMITSGGDPVILDFGLARDAEADAHSLTQTGALFGTPAYMAPEQIMSDQTPLDRRADVWSLGVTLFECLALRRPFQAPTRDALYQAIMRQSLPNIRQLNPSVPRDLAVIIQTAVEKARDRRYGTALDFAEDLRRFLNYEPIHAKPAGPVTRTILWAQRNPAVAVALVVVLLSLSAGLFVSLRQKNRADEALVEKESAFDDLKVEQARTLSEKNRADEALVEKEGERVRAEGALADLKEEQARTLEALAHASAVKDFLNNEVLGQVSPEKGTRDVLVRDVLDRASQRIEGKLEGSPVIEADIRDTIGSTYRDLGVYDLAQPHLERALALRREHFGEDDPVTFDTMNKLGLLYTHQGRLDVALPMHKGSYEGLLRVLGEEHPDTLSSMNNLATLYKELGRYDDAIALYQKVLETRLRTLGEDHPSTLTSMNNLGVFHYQQNRHDLALPLYEKALEGRRRILGEEHPRTITSMLNLASLHHAQGRYDLGLSLYEKALEIRRRVLGDDHRKTIIAMAGLARMYRAQGRRDIGLSIYKKALETALRVLGEEHPSTLSIMNNLAIAHQDEGRYDEALPLYQRTIEVRSRALGEDHPATLSTMHNLGYLYSLQGRDDLASSWFGKTLEKRREVLGGEHSSTLNTMKDLGEVLLRMERHQEARDLFEECLEKRRASLGDRHIKTLQAQSLLGFCMVHQGEYAGAEPLLLDLHRVCSEVLASNDQSIVNSTQLLVYLYDKWGKTEKAAKWRAKLPKDLKK